MASSAVTSSGRTIAEPFAWALTIWGTALYLLAGLFYAIQVVGIVRAERTALASP